jgi:hypothetical protein
VADLSGLAVDTPEQVSADDEPGADGVADADEHRRDRLAAVALAGFGQAAQVGLAVDVHGPADARREALGDVDALPAAQEARCRDHARALVDRRRKSEPHGQQVGQRSAERLHHVAEQQAQPVELGVVAVVEGQGER